MAVMTNAGVTLLATALQSAGVNAAITYVDVAPGCGTLASGLTSGNAYTTLALNAGLPALLTAGQSLTITDGTHSQTVTVSGAGAAAAATSIPVNSFTASSTFATNTTGVCPTPAVADVALYNGAAAVRVAANTGVAGASAGESLNNAYFDGTQATAMYLLVGYFGGGTATSTAGTGTLIFEDVQYWNHVLNADSASFQADSTL